VDDVAFARAVIDQVAERAPLDRARVFAAGFSMGGSMAFALGCLASDAIAGIAVVGMLEAREQEEVCRPARAVPLILFVGTADPVTPWGGRTTDDGFHILGAEATARAWVRRAECAAEPAVDTIPAQDRSGQLIRRYAWRGCTAPAGVTLYRLEGGNHTWPFYNVSASGEIARGFFGVSSEK
jgi:polyhydroxybutyrate depolymerase